MKIAHGTTRTVILLGNRAYKFPTLRYWRGFLRGLIANMDEAMFSGSDSQLCPVIFCLPAGFLNVMPRCRVLTEQENHLVFERAGWLTLDVHHSNFGYLNDNVVCLDYGSEKDMYHYGPPPPD